jgi:hypothetical protein
MTFDANDCHVTLDPFPEGRLAWQGTGIRTGIAV